MSPQDFKELTPEQKAERRERILAQDYIERGELAILINMPYFSGASIFNQLREKMRDDLKQYGLMLPDRNHLPISMIKDKIKLLIPDFDYLERRAEEIRAERRKKGGESHGEETNRQHAEGTVR